MCLGDREFCLMNKMSPNSHVDDLIGQLKRLAPAERDRVLAELMQESTLTLVICGSSTTKFKVITHNTPDSF